MKLSQRAMLPIVALKLLAIATCLFFVFRTLATHWHEVRIGTLREQTGPLAIASCLYALYLLLRGATWHTILRGFTPSSSLPQDTLVWNASLLGKFVPGKVFPYLGRAYVYAKRGIQPEQVAAAFGCEIASLVVVSAALTAIAAATPVGAQALGRYQSAAVAAGALGLLLMHPGLLRGLGRIASTRLKRPFRIDYDVGSVCRAVLAMGVSWVALGSGLFALIRGITDLPMDYLPFTTGAFACAGIAGMLAFFAPSGIGVREGVLASALAMVMLPGEAAAIAIVARLWTTTLEVAAALISMALLRPSMRRRSDR